MKTKTKWIISVILIIIVNLIMALINDFSNITLHFRVIPSIIITAIILAVVFSLFKKRINLLLIFSLFLVSCEKDSNQEIKQPISSASQELKAGDVTFTVSWTAGHEAGGACIYPYWGDLISPYGGYIHIPCVGPGSACSMSVTVTISLWTDGKIELGIPYAGTVKIADYKYDNYPIMRRSILIKSETPSCFLPKMYANFMDDYWYRIGKSDNFEIPRIIFTEKPIFTNY
jgi:hypothetical protein